MESANEINLVVGAGDQQDPNQSSQNAKDDDGQPGPHPSNLDHQVAGITKKPPQITKYNLDKKIKGEYVWSREDLHTYATEWLGLEFRLDEPSRGRLSYYIAQELGPPK